VRAWPVSFVLVARRSPDAKTVPDDAPPGQAADPERQIEPERSRRDYLDGFAAALGAHAHDRTLAERPFDLAKRGIERFVLFHPDYPRMINR